VNGDRVVVLDAKDLHVIHESTGIVQGGGGAQVLAITKTNPPQATSAGGFGRWWWGSSCDIVNGHELTNCARTSDSTVCMGADGVSMYNNQRFEWPRGVARYRLPFPSQPESYNSAYISWPWWIRSDLSGNVYAYDGYALTKYSQKLQQVWQVNSPNAMGLMLTDDESTVVLSNATNLWSLSTASGSQARAWSYGDFGAVSCGTVVSPWANPTPVPMPDSQRVALACADQSGASFVKVANLQTGAMEHGTVSLGVVPDQTLVDSAYNFYSIGTLNDKPTVQRVNIMQSDS